jgi:hypothetical protein
MTEAGFRHCFVIRISTFVISKWWGSPANASRRCPVGACWPALPFPRGRYFPATVVVVPEACELLPALPLWPPWRF